MQTLQELREGKLANITTLKLQEQLLSFPEEIFALKDTLEILDLSGNKLETLPDNLNELTKLKILFCSENAFNHLPEVLGKCKSLDIIGFKSNKIDSIAENALPTSLRWLILTNNKIKKLPDSIGDCKNLQKLMLAGNEIKELPDSLSNCTELGLIRLAANRLTSLPVWLLNLPKLAWLAVSGNPCTHKKQQLLEIDEINWQEVELNQLLGSGASGWIYNATLKTKKENVAIKIFKGSITSDGFPSDEMENCIHAGTHPNLIPLLGKVVNHPEQKNGVVMKLISSSYKNLGSTPSFITCTRDEFPQKQKFSILQAVTILLKLASVCSHLHSKGIMHGDFYAHNILIDPNNDVLLGDFGAATYYNIQNIDFGFFEKIEVKAFGYLIEDIINHFLEDHSELLSNLYVKCVDLNPTLRPTFSEIQQELSVIS